MRKLYYVDLTEQERTELLALTRRGSGNARMIRRAHALLLADEGKTDEEIADAQHVWPLTIGRLRKRFAQLSASTHATQRTERVRLSIEDKPRPGQKPKLSGKQEALLTALACSKAPDGQSRWSLRLLSDRFVALGEHDASETGQALPSISHETVRRILKKAI